PRRGTAGYSKQHHPPAHTLRPARSAQALEPMARRLNVATPMSVVDRPDRTPAPGGRRLVFPTAPRGPEEEPHAPSRSGSIGRSRSALGGHRQIGCPSGEQNLTRIQEKRGRGQAVAAERTTAGRAPRSWRTAHIPPCQTGRTTGGAPAPVPPAAGPTARRRRADRPTPGQPARRPGPQPDRPAAAPLLPAGTGPFRPTRRDRAGGWSPRAGLARRPHRPRAAAPPQDST